MNIKLNGGFSIDDDEFSFKDLEIDISESVSEGDDFEDVLNSLFLDGYDIEFLDEDDMDAMELEEYSIDECEQCMFGGDSEVDINLEIAEGLVDWYANEIAEENDSKVIATLLASFVSEILNI